MSDSPRADGQRCGGGDIDVGSYYAPEVAPCPGCEDCRPEVVPMVEVARVRALVAWLYPTDMTPIARRQILSVCEEVESRYGK